LGCRNKSIKHRTTAIGQLTFVLQAPLCAPFYDFVPVCR
jgi:hypothetical protein